MNNTKLLITMIICGFATFGMRALPFIIFDPKRGIPKKVKALGDMLPSAVMATLVIYCLKSVSPSNITGSIQLIIASISVVVIHLIKRNTILSICVGTIVYMILLRVM